MLVNLTERAEREVARLKEAIRKHRDQRGDDRCYFDDYELYAAIGEVIPYHACQLCDPETMLDNCRKFIASRHDPKKPYLSPQRLIERIEKLEDQVSSLRAANAPIGLGQ